MKKLALALCIGGWLLLVIRTVIYSLQIPDHMTVLGIDVTQELASGRFWGLIWIGTGLLFAVLALFIKRGWQALAAISALLYLADWYMVGPMPRVGVIHGYKLLWQLALTLHLYEPFVVRDVVLPITFVTASILAGVSAFRRRPRPTNGQVR